LAYRGDYADRLSRPAARCARGRGRPFAEHVAIDALGHREEVLLGAQVEAPRPLCVAELSATRSSTAARISSIATIKPQSVLQASLIWGSTSLGRRGAGSVENQRDGEREDISAPSSTMGCAVFAVTRRYRLATSICLCLLAATCSLHSRRRSFSVSYHCLDLD
jgi:hypothetical protein